MVYVSAVLEKLINSLGLWEFPCGPGPWKQSADEDPQILQDVLDCPSSPWHQEPTWSPQAAALRRRAVLSHKALTRSSVYRHFTALRLMDQGVTVLDSGLLRLSNLEELVLSANHLQEVPAFLLPVSLTVLELQNNQLRSLSLLTTQPPPRLLYLGLAYNPLGSALDVCSLTGAHWPTLLCLDLSFCDFENQRILLGALSSLPCLRSLLLEGNPCSLGFLYPGLTLDFLPQLSYLDSERVRAEEKEAFRGLALLTGAEQESAHVTVHVGRLRGLPDPTVRNLFAVYTGSTHSSCSLPWSDCMDFSETHHHSVSDLRALKSFVRRGMCVHVVEDKTLSWPAVAEDTAPKPAFKESKGAKGKEPPNKGASTKDKGKDKKRAPPELVQDPPIRTLLGTVHVPLHSLLHSGHTVALCCDFGPQGLDTTEADNTMDKDVRKMVKEDKKREEDSKAEASGKKTDTAKGKAKSVKEVDEAGAWGPLEPITVELCVQLDRWQSAVKAADQPDLRLMAIKLKGENME
ncbi:leucine-rich repeat-containing protein 43-like [Periophthalmus magnuspinnatus]|uniref:leucine-rich repeat-containing protein 43-like n=1 Tax=Periophthalmus magnuspinnatus TaxID=409849 RepID=UPI00145C085D|nr:leucine-rich repeat-containing protein 43-like [Periophthalmus magnuspinnatus]